MNQLQLETQSPRSRQNRSWTAHAQSHEVLSAAMADAETLPELYEVATGWIADESEAEYVCIRITEGGQQTVSAVGEAEWSPLAQGVLIRTAETRKPLVRMLEADNGASHAVVGVPLSIAAAGTGAIVAIVECGSFPEARECLRNLAQLTRLFTLAVDGLSDRLQRRGSTKSHLGVCPNIVEG